MAAPHSWNPAMGPSEQPVLCAERATVSSDCPHKRGNGAPLRRFLTWSTGEKRAIRRAMRTVLRAAHNDVASEVAAGHGRQGRGTACAPGIILGLSGVFYLVFPAKKPQAPANAAKTGRSLAGECS